MTKTNSSSLLYGTLLLTFSGLFGQLLGFLYRIALSRLIGAEIMGLYQLIMPVYSVIMSLTAVGLTVAASTLSAEFHATGQPAAIRQVRGRCLTLFFLLLVPIALLTFCFSDQISVYILGDARTRLGLVLLLPCILLTGVENLQKHTFFGVGNVRPPACTELAEQVVRACAVLGLLTIFLPQNPEKTVGIIVLGMVICEVFSALVLTLLFRRYLGGKKEVAIAPKLLHERIWRIALPVGGTALLGNLMGSANAILIPQKLVAGGADVASAMSAFGVITGMTLPMLCLPSAFIGALRLILVPKLSEAMATGQHRQVARQLDGVLLSTSLLMMPAMALLVVVGPTLAVLLFGDARAGGYITPLAVGVLLSCYESVLSGALTGIGAQNPAARNALLSSGVQLLFTFFLVEQPGIGLGGYVAGLVVSTLVGVALNWHSLQRAIGLKANLFAWMVAPALGSILAGLCGNLLFQKLLNMGADPVIAVVSTVVFATVLYLAALQGQGVNLNTRMR